MDKKDRWTGTFREASEEVSNWRKAHPRATFTDIENTVDEQLAQIRARMIEDLVMESQLTHLSEMPMKERPKCPGCGQPLVSNGSQSRTLVTTHEQTVELERSKGYCRHCQVSFFPPG